MPKRKTLLRPVDLLDILPDKLRSPLGFILGGSRDVAEFIAARNSTDDVCYQMDLYQAEQLQDDLERSHGRARIITAADLWDVPEPLQTLIYPVAEKGERSLKLDMVEQAFHALQPGGTLIVLSPVENDQLFPPLFKKIFGKVHIPPAGKGQVFWGQRQGDRPKRRHEISYHVRRQEGASLHFVSRPGVFSYGKFDSGARALTETMTIEPGDKILDVGCGTGTNGIEAGLRAGPEGKVVFVDSNVRALALTVLNARTNGLTNFRTIASSKVEDIGEDQFDVALANPPYFAQNAIARLFIQRCRQLLRPGGRFFLVTKNTEAVAQLVVEWFPDTEVVFRRGYAIFCAYSG